MAKPAILCKLKKGKIIDSHKGFVETFNWLVDTLDDLTKNAKEIDVVVGTEYDTDTHKLKNKTKSIKVLAIVDDIESEDEVFTAVPLSEEE